MMTRTIRRLALIAASCFACLEFVAPAAAQGTSDGFPDAFDLVPPDAAAAIVIPNLKRASDDIAQLLQSMGQNEALVGGRPIDQVRALLGFHAGIDETGPMVVVYPTIAADVSPIITVPTLNAAEFLTANLTNSDEAANAYRDTSGRTWFVRTVEDFVVMCASAEALASHEPGDGLRAALAEQFDDAAAMRTRRGDIVIYEIGEAAIELTKLLQARAVEMQNEQATPDIDLGGPFTTQLSASVRSSLIVFNFDPLGLGVNAFSSLKAETELAEIAQRATGATATMDHLPDHPFYLAMAIDAAGLGGPATLSMLAPADGAVPAWAAGVEGVELFISPSVLGLQGGLLNEGILFIETDDPASVKGAIRDALAEAMQGPGFTATPTWEPATREIDGVTTDGYAIELAFTDPQPQQSMVQSLLFGRGGIKGFIAESGGGLVLTFSRRPDVLQRAISATRGGSTLADNAMLTQMRTWLPSSPAFEAFFGMGEFGKVVRNLMQQFGGLMPPEARDGVPQIDPGVKPMGFALDLRPGIVESGAVLPADALNVFFDAALEQMMQRFRQPEPQPSDDQ